MNRLYARSNAEAHLYMDLHPCPCGERQFERRSAVITEGETLCSRYAGPCKSCGTLRAFVFELPEAILPVRKDHVEYGRSDPSRLLDPGEWMDLADTHARRQPATRHDLDVARAAIEEVMKFVPPGDERVPDDAFRTDRGRALRDAEPGRFRKIRLETVLGVYRELLARARPAPAANGRAEPTRPVEPSAASAPAAPEAPLDQYPLQALVEAVAKVAAKQQGFEGDELRRHASSFAGQVQTLVKLFQIKSQEERQRKQSTAEVEQLLDGIVRTGTAAGNAIAAHRDTIVQAFRGVDLGQIASGVQVLVQWLQNPTAETHAPVQELLANLQAALGPMTSASPEGEADASHDRIHQEMRASLVQMFGQTFGQPLQAEDKKPT